MLKKILIALAVIVAVFLVVVAKQPDEFSVTRSATMNAPAKDVFAQINDFHKWQAWSPWAKMDPDAKNEFAGAKSGKGAIFKWDGNHEVGKGAMTITHSKPNEIINIQLDFEKPMNGTNIATFTFKPEGKNTIVTWAMNGQANFAAKAIGLIMNCDKMVGEQFEAGLNNIKAIVEKSPKK